jgi:diguanylate cyclase (GGDEF)-like protein
MCPSNPYSRAVVSPRGDSIVVFASSTHLSVWSRASVPTQEAILTLLIVAIAANITLMAAVLIVPRLRRSRGRGLAGAGTLAMAGGPGRPAVAFAQGGPTARVAGEDGVHFDVRNHSEASAPQPPAGTLRSIGPTDSTSDDQGEQAPQTEPDDAADVVGNPLVDPPTGLDSPLFWSHAIHAESARTVRYGRPATVVLAELDGLERLVDRFGQDAADRLVLAVAAAIRRDTRSADRVARLGPGEFGVLLPETDEVQAINFVERVRATTDLWLEAGAVAVRLAIGWANVGADQSLEVALHVAENRLNGDRRVMRSAPGPRPVRSSERPAS